MDFKSKRTQPTAFLLFVGALLCFMLLRTKEPAYRGETLRSWLQQCSDTPTMETQKRSEAQDAVRAIGAEKAIPTLLRMAEAQDGPLRAWILEKRDQWNIRFIKMQEAGEIHQLAIAGFEALGTNGAPAVAKLTTLLGNRNLAFTALRCLLWIGKPAEIPVCQTLTNKDPDLRRVSASEIARVTEDMDLFLSRLSGPLNDPDDTVRLGAVQALGIQTHAPDAVIPLLLKALKDPAGSVSSHAFQFLGDFGTNGSQAFPVLSNIVVVDSGTQASRALQAMRRISPERTLPMILNWARSSDARQRSTAAIMLGGYSVVTPEMIATLKGALNDSDTKVAQSARRALTEQRRKQPAKSGNQVEMPSEPSYAGKSLSQWLKLSPTQTDYSAEASKAITIIGTNGIPALLNRLTYKDPDFGLPDYEVNLEAAKGFTVLGQLGQAALPVLKELIEGEDESIALFALVSAANMGSNSLPILTQALTNRYDDVRNQAVCLFTEEPTRHFPEARRRAIPTIMKLLEDPHPFVRMNATNALKEIDPVAAANFGLK